MKRQTLIFLLMTISVLSFGQPNKLKLYDSLIVTFFNIQDEICSGNNGSISVSALGGFMPYTYIWNTTPPQFTPMLTNLSAGTYSVTVTDDSLNTASATINIINSQPTCTVIVLQNDTNGQGTGILAANVSGGEPPYTFFWSSNAGLPGDTAATNLTAGLYTVTVYDANGCPCISSSTIINATCSAQFTLFPDTISHHYIATSYVSGFPPLAYEWSWGDGTYNYTANPSHTYSVAGNYTICLTVTDDLSCTSTYCDTSYLQKSTNDIIYVNVIPYGTTEIIANKLSNLIKVYPNPNNGKFTLTNTDNIKIFEVINMLGEAIYTLTIDNNSTEIDLTAVPKGIYFVKINSGEKVYIEKVVLY